MVDHETRWTATQVSSYSWCTAEFHSLTDNARNFGLHALTDGGSINQPQNLIPAPLPPVTSRPPNISHAHPTPPPPVASTPIRQRPRPSRWPASHTMMTARSPSKMPHGRGPRDLGPKRRGGRRGCRSRPTGACAAVPWSTDGGCMTGLPRATTATVPPLRPMAASLPIRDVPAQPHQWLRRWAPSRICTSPLAMAIFPLPIATAAPPVVALTRALVESSLRSADKGGACSIWA